MQTDQRQATLFPSKLGWIGVMWRDSRVERLLFGYADRGTLLEQLPGASIIQRGRWSAPQQQLARLLDAYARGEPVSLTDVEVCWDGASEFVRRVWRACRQIPYGSTVTYGELARRVGAPRAARAVGRAMATNPVPLVVPCHRVVASNGGLGGFSAVGGISLKARLLEMERGGAAVAASPRSTDHVSVQDGAASQGNSVPACRRRRAELAMASAAR